MSYHFTYNFKLDSNTGHNIAKEDTSGKLVAYRRQVSNRYYIIYAILNFIVPQGEETLRCIYFTNTNTRQFKNMAVTELKPQAKEAS